MKGDGSDSSNRRFDLYLHVGTTWVPYILSAVGQTVLLGVCSYHRTTGMELRNRPFRLIWSDVEAGWMSYADDSSVNSGTPDQSRKLSNITLACHFTPVTLS